MKILNLRRFSNNPVVWMYSSGPRDVDASSIISAMLEFFERCCREEGPGGTVLEAVRREGAGRASKSR